MKTTLVTLLAAAALLGLGSSARAHDLLGTRTVAYLSDHDTIRVHQDRPFRQIRLCVSEHAVRFRDLDVSYRSGGRQDLKIRRLIPAGECTRWIDLNGKNRWLVNITMHYDTYGNAGPRAVVKAYGR